MESLTALIDVFFTLDLAGKIIIFILTFMSIYMWGLIIAKSVALKAVERGNHKALERLKTFQAHFSRDYVQLFRDFPDTSVLPLYRIYRTVCDYLFTHDSVTQMDLIAAEKLVDASTAEQVNDLEEGLNFLSVTATIAPFLGLLGTVWGIMVSFRRMTQAGSTTISTVAPGIAVALVTTVVGLIVAIPAVIAFYHFRRRINAQLVVMEKFGKELIARIGRCVLQEEQK